MWQGYSKANQTAQGQDSLRWGCDYLLKLIAPVKGTSGTRQEYNIIYQVWRLTNLTLVGK